MAAAMVSLLAVTVKRAYAQPRQNYFRYDGTVKLQASSLALNFVYSYQFKDEESIQNAIQRATTMLKNELDALSAATRSVNRSDPRRSDENEEDYEALGEEE